MQHDKLKDIFAQFTGREVSTLGGSNTPPFPGFNASIKLDPQDAAIVELRKAIEDAGFSVRVLLPGTPKTMDIRANRVNVSVSPDMKGVYRIGGYKIG